MGLRPLALRDVGQDALGADDFSVRINDGNFDDVHELLLTVRRRILFNLLNGFAGGHDLPVMLIAFGGMLGDLPRGVRLHRHGGGNFPGCLAQKFLRLQTFQPAEPGADKHIAAGRIFAKNSGGQLVHERMIKRVRFPQRRRRLLVRGDVQGQDEIAQHRAVGRTARHIADVEIIFLPVATRHPVLITDGASGHHLPKMRHHRRVGRGAVDFAQRAAEDLLAWPPEPFLEIAVHELVAFLRVNIGDEVRHRINEQLERGKSFLHLGLGLLAPGDVAQDAQHPAVGQHGRAGFAGEQRAVLVPALPFTVRHLAGKQTRQLRRHAGRLGHGDNVGAAQRQHFFPGVTEHPAGHRVHVQQPALRVRDQDGVGRGLDKRAVIGLARAQRRFRPPLVLQNAQQRGPRPLRLRQMPARLGLALHQRRRALLHPRLQFIHRPLLRGLGAFALRGHRGHAQRRQHHHAQK